MKHCKTLLRLLVILTFSTQLAGCDDPKVYGSIGVSSYHGSSGYYGGPRVGGSIVVGGRIR